jgi:hypothetical protein
MQVALFKHELFTQSLISETAKIANEPTEWTSNLENKSKKFQTMIGENILPLNLVSTYLFHNMFLWNRLDSCMYNHWHDRHKLHCSDTSYSHNHRCLFNKKYFHCIMCIKRFKTYLFFITETYTMWIYNITLTVFKDAFHNFWDRFYTYTQARNYV